MHGLQIINVADAYNPSIEGSYDTPSAAHAVHVSGNYAYVADWSSGMKIVDISDPANPSLAGEFEIEGYTEDVAVSGDFAYIANHPYGLQVVSVSDVSEPVLVGSYSSVNYLTDIAIDSNYVYITDEENGLIVLDISNPSEPVYAGSYDTPGVPQGVYVFDNYACIADGYSALILEIGTVSGVKDSNNMPKVYSLFQNYPNPFNAKTIISYDLPCRSDVTIDIYDVLGRRVDRLIDTSQPAGNHQVIWNASDVASGMYFYKLTAGDYTASKKLVLVK
jgi:hypothetical protein